MRPAPPLSITRPRNTRPARCVTRRFTGRMSTPRSSNRGCQIEDWKSSAIGGTGKPATARQAIAPCVSRPGRCRSGACCCQWSAKAQAQRRPRRKLQPPAPSASPRLASARRVHRQNRRRLHRSSNRSKFGYRDSMINGNLNNYDTFENLHLRRAAVRLHGGHAFDRTTRASFSTICRSATSGYGGDPNDISRLRIDKNKWYDFRAHVPAGQELSGITICWPIR